MRDSLVVTNTGELFEVFGKSSEPWKAYRVKVEPFNPNIGVDLDLPWSEVGVHRYFQASSIIFSSIYVTFPIRFAEHDYSVVHRLYRADIRCKAMQFGNEIIEWRNEWLQSKYDE